ncbi:MAG: cob(I)yrinic acid a,c-diamide adenosyltransferase [Candidatus Thorarchaeota archaeon]|jgi:cob(I)alamin adenosyltransferase
MNSAEQPGKVQVFTGDGKGKTTCALGAGLRAAGHGLRVLMISFMKAKVAERDGETEVNYGEFGAVEQVPNFEIVPVGRLDWVDKENPDPIDVKLAQDGLELARDALRNRSCDVIILDEINVAVEWNLISLEDQLSLIKAKPPDVEMIMTGRYARSEVIEAADLVTELREIKHYYTSERVQARKGFEF